MTRRALTLGLLVSVGVNLGVLGAIAAGRFADRGGAGPVAAPGGEPAAPQPAEPVLREPGAESPVGVDPPDLGGYPTGGAASIDGPELGVPADDDPDRTVAPEIGGTADDPAAPPEPAAGATRPYERGRDGPRWRARHPGAPPVERLADRLGLEGETRERFLAVQRRWFETLAETRRERERLTLELRRELAAELPDRARIAELVERLGEAYAAGEAATAEAVLDSRALLDPRQQELYGRFLRHLAEREVAPHGPRRGGRPFGRSRPSGQPP